jgi:hypothetical protein
LFFFFFLCLVRPAAYGREKLTSPTKKNASNEPKKGNKGEINLTHKEETKGDSTSQSLSSSSLEDSDGSSNNRLHSKTSINEDEEMSTTDGG